MTATENYGHTMSACTCDELAVSLAAKVNAAHRHAPTCSEATTTETPIALNDDVSLAALIGAPLTKEI
jgi:hypothetical protein